MKLLAAVEGDARSGARWCRPLRSRRYPLMLQPRLPLNALIALHLPGCPALDDDAITAWLEHAYHERPLAALRPQTFALARLADFADALNALDHLHFARGASTTERAEFARDRGGLLLADIRGALAGEAALRDLPQRVRRFAIVCADHPGPGEPASESSRILDELAGQHDVEHLMGLEHAVARWVAAASDPRETQLMELARTVPEADTSAGTAHAWFVWWWSLSGACTRVDLMTIVDRAVDFVDDECTAGRREPVAVDARTEARRMASRMHDATHARLWAGPPHDRRHPTPDLDDAHYTAFMAVSHAAHALAHAWTGQLGPRTANRMAMRRLAEQAVQFLREELAEAQGDGS